MFVRGGGGGGVGGSSGGSGPKFLSLRGVCPTTEKIKHLLEVVKHNFSTVDVSRSFSYLDIIKKEPEDILSSLISSAFVNCSQELNR